ncbi:MAG: adenosylcobinamide-phosphate synthase CbiB [Oscillospiraceae bacterium]|jgi:adenosylcobinamide-phosphate synthase
MTILFAVLCGFVLDLVLGDPAWMPHPVVYMGKCITVLERRLRAWFAKTERGELLAGSMLAALLPVGTLCFSASAIWLFHLLSPVLGFLLQVLWCWQALAIRGLKEESCNVYQNLVYGSLPDARRAVARIVGRDTEQLTAEGVTKAAVETVAENFSDGVVAPMLFMMLGGAPLALCYKAINTMDSMVGYRNDRYLYFGRAAARLDDVANYIPSRFAALLLCVSAALTGQNAYTALKIWRRDRRCHASPNSAQTESAVAGALGIQLAGPAWYFGTLHQKPMIGDSIRPIEPQDILRVNRMLYVASVLCLVILGMVRAMLGGLL